MLLMDRITQFTEAARARYQQRAHKNDVPIHSAARFRLDEKAVSFCEAVSIDEDRLRAQARHLFWPGEHCWIEWAVDGVAWGVRYIGYKGDLHVGSLNLYMWPKDEDVPIIGLGRCDMMRSVPFDIRLGSSFQSLLGDNIDADAFNIAHQQWAISPMPTDEPDEDIRDIATTVLTTLSLLNSPRIVRVIDISRVKLNNARMKGGKFPLLAYKEVTVDLAKKQITALRLDSDGNRRPLHWVRAHLRFRVGQWELVKPHWRGDASLGIKRPAYKLTRGIE